MKHNPKLIFGQIIAVLALYAFAISGCTPVTPPPPVPTGAATSYAASGGIVADIAGANRIFTAIKPLTNDTGKSLAEQGSKNLDDANGLVQKNIDAVTAQQKADQKKIQEVTDEAVQAKADAAKAVARANSLLLFILRMLIPIGIILAVFGLFAYEYSKDTLTFCKYLSLSGVALALSGGGFALLVSVAISVQPIIVAVLSVLIVAGGVVLIVSLILIVKDNWAALEARISKALHGTTPAPKLAGIISVATASVAKKTSAKSEPTAIPVVAAPVTVAAAA